MIVFYLLIISLALPEHYFFAAGVGELTVIKVIGLACMVYAFGDAASSGRWPNFVATTPGRLAAGYVGALGVSLLTRELETPLGTFIGLKVLAISATIVSTIVILRSFTRVRNAVIVTLGAMAVASTYVIKQFVTFHELYTDFRSWGGVSGDPNYYAIAAVLWLP